MALGLICLAATFGADGLRRRGLSLHAHLQAAALITVVVTDAAGANTAEYIAAAAAGLIIGPSLAFRVGHALAAHHPQRF